MTGEILIKRSSGHQLLTRLINFMMFSICLLRVDSYKSITKGKLHSKGPTPDPPLVIVRWHQLPRRGNPIKLASLFDLLRKFRIDHIKVDNRRRESNWSDGPWQRKWVKPIRQKNDDSAHLFIVLEDISLIRSQSQDYIIVRDSPVDASSKSVASIDRGQHLTFGRGQLEGLKDADKV